MLKIIFAGIETTLKMNGSKRLKSPNEEKRGNRAQENSWRGVLKQLETAQNNKPNNDIFDVNNKIMDYACYYAINYFNILIFVLFHQR